jgi:hypothetical protein
VLLFESLDTANEKVFFHCDQVSALPARHSSLVHTMCIC